MKTKLKIGMIGAGNMGLAILNGIYKEHKVSVCELDSRRRQILKKKFRITAKPLSQVVKDSDIIILAIKPQGFESVLSELKNELTKKKIIVSIAAGITTKFIEKRLSIQSKVIRTMPNLPAQVKKGMTGICRGKHATTNDLKKIQNIFNLVGETVVVQEKLMDSITAISGSGPAYVFLFVEQFQKAAISLGLTEAMSDKLIKQTIHGSLELLDQQKLKADILRERVTSKGGTTHAALSVFKSNGTEKIFKDALKAAQKRAKQLSK